MTHPEIMQFLHQNSSPTLRDFSCSLTPGVSPQNMLGVKIPVLRKLAREIVKGDWREFLAWDDNNIVELLILKGVVIATAKMKFEERLSYIADFVPKIDNWAVCDVFCSSIKPKGEEVEQLRAFVAPYFEAEDEFAVRFAVVVSMNICKGEAEIAKMLEALANVKHQGYYVKMAVAWAVSVYYVRCREIILPYIEGRRFEVFTHNKAIQKICESYRVDEDDKKMLKMLKIKV